MDENTPVGLTADMMDELLNKEKRTKKKHNPPKFKIENSYVDGPTRSCPPTVAEIIQNMPLDPEYTPVDNLPIPLHKGVLVKKIKQTIIHNGLILIEGANTQQPHVGIIAAIGPNCSEHVRVGLRCMYNYFVDSSIRFKGEEYAKMDEMDVYYILPPEAKVIETPKDEAQVRREKKFPEQDARIQRLYSHEQNEKDQIEERLKKLRPKGKA